jgi:hypothetical protein
MSSSRSKPSLTSLGSTLNSIEKLTSINFHAWKFQMTQLLKYRGLWKLVNGTEVAPAALADDNKEQKEQVAIWEEKNDEAMALITLSLSTSELATVREAANASCCLVSHPGYL